MIVFILRFELRMRASCPITAQPFEQPCTVSSFQMLDKALGLSHNATGLRPYTNYDFMIVAYNDEGLTQSPVAIQATLGAGRHGPRAQFHSTA